MVIASTGNEIYLHLRKIRRFWAVSFLIRWNCTANTAKRRNLPQFTAISRNLSQLTNLLNSKIFHYARKNKKR